MIQDFEILNAKILVEVKMRIHNMLEQTVLERTAELCDSEARYRSQAEGSRQQRLSRCTM